MSETQTLVSEPAAAPAPAAVAPATGSALSGGTGAAPDARSWLPEEYRADPTFRDLADVNALAKGYKHAASMVGIDKAEVIRLPKEGPIPDDVWSRLGRPAEPAGYELKGPESIRPEVLSGFGDVAHKLGLSKAQAAGLVEFVGGLEGPTMEARAAAEAEAIGSVVTKLREEWGATYNDRVAKIEQLAQQKGVGFEAVDALVKGGHVGALNLLSAAADLMLEKPGLAGSGGASSGAETPAEARAKIETLSRDREFLTKLNNRDNPDHAAARRQWDELHDWAFSHEPRNQRPAA